MAPVARLMLCLAAWLGAAQPSRANGPQQQAPLSPAAWGPTLQTLLKLPPWLNLSLDLTAEPMGGQAAPLGSSGAWMQQVAFNAALSRGLGKDRTAWQELDHWKANLQLMAYSGNPNLNQRLGTAFPLQTTAHPVGLWLTEASVQREAAGGSVFVKAGLMSMNPGFVQTDVLNSYVHSALNNTLNLEINGLPINPYMAPAASLHLRLGHSSELRLGQFWLDNVNNLAGMFGVNPQQPPSVGSLQLVQWNFSDLPGSALLEQPIRQGTRLVARQLPQPMLQLGGLNTTGPQPNVGLYGSLTLAVPLPIGLDHRIWVGFNHGLTPQDDPYPTFMAGGWLAQGLLPGRPLDVLALGYGRTTFGNSFGPGLKPEGVLELNYTIPLNSTVALQPVVQWILQPGGNSNRGPALAAGVQLNLSF